MTKEEKFIKQLSNPLMFKLAMIKMLPMVWLAGIKVRNLQPESARVEIRYKYITKNPFKSLYFACLAMAAELSTGILALMKITASGQKVSMLVTGMNAQFYKKATGKVYFTCQDGAQFKMAIENAVNTGEGQVLKTVSNGVDENGQPIARFEFEWSFKSKN